MVLLSLPLAACVAPGSVPCGDGTECPAGQICARENLCLFPEQTTVCASLIDGDRCTAAGMGGICDGGLCIPGCGDGVVVDEECDDGNLASHDGCSSACRLEELTWTEWESPWAARSAGAIAYHATRGRYVVFGGMSEERPVSEHWERATDGTWTLRDPALAAPPARANHMMAYDADRQVIVVFGGNHPISGALGDTWEYDAAGNWIKITPPSSPLPRAYSAMTFVPGTGIVLFGGKTGGTAHSDTWIYRDGIWTSPPQSTMAPSQRHLATMVYDTVRQRIVMFGGYAAVGGLLDETWEYDVQAQQWAPIAPATRPPKRMEHAMVFMPGRNVVVLFGGNNGSGSLGDTWEYNGSTWTERLPGPTPPPGRSRAMMATNGTGRAILLGGARFASGGTSELDDLWELDGTNPTVSRWTDATPRFSPRGGSPLAYDSVRGNVVTTRGSETWLFDDERATWEQADVSSVGERGAHGTAYDDARDRVVVFGGFRPGAFVEETMTWDGATWTLHTGPGPSTRSVPALAYHAGDGVVVMFGGVLATGVHDFETWEWNGSWSQVTSAQVPSVLAPAMAYDHACKQIVMYGFSTETWSYAGRQWQLIETQSSPGRRGYAELAFDTRRQRIVLFGGRVNDGSPAMDLWELVRADGGCDAPVDDCTSSIATWCPAPIVGTAPAPRVRVGFAYRANARTPGLLMFGGLLPGWVAPDTWMLHYISSTPDEDCTNGVDDDTDRRIDADDADCKRYP